MGRQGFLDDLTDLWVGKGAGGDEVPAALFGFVGFDVGLSDVTNIRKAGDRGRSRLFRTSIHQPIDVSTACVQAFQARAVLQRPVDHGRADSSNIEVGFLVLDEVISCLLRERLARTVGNNSRPVLCLVVCDWVPVFLAIGVAWTSSFHWVTDGCEAGGDDDTFDLGRVLLDCLEY